HIRAHPLVDPGNPPHSSTSRAKTHSTHRCHRMVALAARSSGRSTEISSQTKITTVMLARGQVLPPPARGRIGGGLRPHGFRRRGNENSGGVFVMRAAARLRLRPATPTPTLPLSGGGRRQRRSSN